MPFYSYVCSEGHTNDEFFAIGQKPKTITCHCKKRATFRVSFPQVQFKGDGFTRTVETPERKKMKGKTFVDKQTEKFYYDNNLVAKDDLIVNL